MDKTITTDQRSSIWYSERLGKFTSSEIHKLMKEPRSKTAELSDTARTYILDKVAEVITGESPQVNSWAMEWGIDNEPLAKKWFVKLTGFDLKECGFHGYGEHAGGSPDGIVNGNAILEIKCPAVSTNHVKHLLIDTPAYMKDNFPEYYYQMQANMLFCNKDKGYFVSFDPRVQSDIGFFLFELPYNAEDGAAIIAKVETAIEYKKKYLNQIIQAKQVAA